MYENEDKTAHKDGTAQKHYRASYEPVHENFQHNLVHSFVHIEFILTDLLAACAPKPVTGAFPKQV